MIKKRTPLSMAEVMEYAKDNEELMKFIKNFNQLKENDAKSLRKKLVELNMMKMKEDHIAKIIDTIPQDNEDLNKIFIGVSLDENETNNILNTIKEFK